MAELEEGKVPERDSEKEPKKGGKNSLQSFLSRKVKIFGREIPIPLLMLGALVLGIIVFSILGKRRGNGESTQQTDDTQSSFGFSERPNSLNDMAQGSMVASEGELSADLGQTFTPSPLPSFEPLPVITPSPLPEPQLPYADFGNYFTPAPIADFQPINTGLPMPVEQPFYPIRDVLPSVPPTINRTPATMIRGGTKGKEPKARTLPVVTPRPTPIGGTPKPALKPIKPPAPRPMPKPPAPLPPRVGGSIGGFVLPRPPVVRPPVVQPRPVPVPPRTIIGGSKPKPGTKPLPGKAGFLR